MEATVRLVLGAILAVSAAAKLRGARQLPAALAPYGVPPGLRAPAAVALVGAEAVLAALLLTGAGGSTPAWATAALGGLFALGVGNAARRGRRQLPCACFGPGRRERPVWLLATRALALSALAALLASGLPARVGTPSRDALVLAALAVLSLAVAALTVVVVALSREIGVLHLRLGPRSVLELEDEGPPLRRPVPPLPGVLGDGAELVVFSSPGCRLCRELAAGVRALARDGLAVRVVDEELEGDAFPAWNVPGTPYAVLVVDGESAAKGLVNSLEQLEALVALGGSRALGAAA